MAGVFGAGHFFLPDGYGCFCGAGGAFLREGVELKYLIWEDPAKDCIRLVQIEAVVYDSEWPGMIFMLADAGARRHAKLLADGSGSKSTSVEKSCL